MGCTGSTTDIKIAKETSTVHMLPSRLPYHGHLTTLSDMTDKVVILYVFMCTTYNCACQSSEGAGAFSFKLPPCLVWKSFSQIQWGIKYYMSAKATCQQVHVCLHRWFCSSTFSKIYLNDCILYGTFSFHLVLATAWRTAWDSSYRLWSPHAQLPHIDDMD